MCCSYVSYSLGIHSATYSTSLKSTHASLFSKPALNDAQGILVTKCLQALKRQETQGGIPRYLLMAIACVESGRAYKNFVYPWPWTINVEGKDYRFHTKHDAVKAVERFRRLGHKSIDVGCMQINLKHHPHAFSSLSDAFDIEKNVRYAARFLKNLYARFRDWKKAIAHYHSASFRGKDYQRKVLSRMEGRVFKVKMNAFTQSESIFAFNPSIAPYVIERTRPTMLKTIALRKKPLKKVVIKSAPPAYLLRTQPKKTTNNRQQRKIRRLYTSLKKAQQLQDERVMVPSRVTLKEQQSVAQKALDTHHLKTTALLVSKPAARSKTTPLKPKPFISNKQPAYKHPVHARIIDLNPSKKVRIPDALEKKDISHETKLIKTEKVLKKPDEKKIVLEKPIQQFVPVAPKNPSLAPQKEENKNLKPRYRIISRHQAFPVTLGSINAQKGDRSFKRFISLH